jgi:cytochrome c oxidase subunit 3
VRATRAVADVSALPRTVFGHRSLMWWGTLGFIVIEGTTLFISAVSYFYLRRNYSTWPPEHIFRPALLIPTIQVTLMLASNVPMWLADRASRRMDLATVRKWFLVCSALALVMTILRWFEFEALNVRWDTSSWRRQSPLPCCSTGTRWKIGICRVPVTTRSTGIS